LRCGADPAVDVGSVPDRDDAAGGHGERFGGGLQIVNGENGSLNDQVSGGHMGILSGLGKFLE
jgi:hypothetical protein